MRDVEFVKKSPFDILASCRRQRACGPVLGEPVATEVEDRGAVGCALDLILHGTGHGSPVVGAPSRSSAAAAHRGKHQPAHEVVGERVTEQHTQSFALAAHQQPIEVG
jgi:hypothetical protein